MEKIELKVHKPKTPRMTSVEETIQLARIQQAVASSALYERKHNQKALKVVTVAAYILFVSMAAITLSFYYVFIWDPSTKPLPPRNTGNCDNKVVIPESLAIRLANSTEITAENFFKNIFRSYQALQQNKQQPIEVSATPNPLMILASSSSSSSTIPPKPSKTIKTSSSSTSLPTMQTAEKSPISTSSSSLPSSSSILSFNGASVVQNHREDDEDTENDIDYENSGMKPINWNDTTIQLDEYANEHGEKKV